MLLRKNNPVDEGKIGESIAEELLVKKGYKIIQKNFRTKFGEIDIIAQDAEGLIFVEVKLRKNTKFGSPEEAVTPRKINKIMKVGEFFLAKHPHLSLKARVEVVAIEMDGEEKIVRSEIIRV